MTDEARELVRQYLLDGEECSLAIAVVRMLSIACDKKWSAGAVSQFIFTCWSKTEADFRKKGKLTKDRGHRVVRAVTCLRNETQGLRR